MSLRQRLCRNFTATDCICAQGGLHPVYWNTDMFTGQLLNSWVDSLQSAWPGILVSGNCLLRLLFSKRAYSLCKSSPNLGFGRRAPRRQMSASAAPVNMATIRFASRALQPSNEHVRTCLLPSSTGIRRIHILPLSSYQESCLSSNWRHDCKQPRKICSSKVSGS